VIGEVEKPLFRAVLNYTDGNQSRAAEILGINRGTLRKKMRNHRLATN
jgi:Fis family transcriptional regulator